jgi:hypothetical protein
MKMQGNLFDHRMPVQRHADPVDVRAALAALVRGDSFMVV